MQTDLDLTIGVEILSEDSPLVPAYLEYEVEAILAAKMSYSSILSLIIDDYYYLVKWKNWSIHESTWEPEEHLKSSRKLVLDFLKKKNEGVIEFDWKKYPELRKFWANKGEQNPKKQRGRPKKNTLENYSNDESLEKRIQVPREKRIQKSGKNGKRKDRHDEEKHCEEELIQEIEKDNAPSKMEKIRVFKEKEVPLFLNVLSTKEAQGSETQREDHGSKEIEQGEEEQNKESVFCGEQEIGSSQIWEKNSSINEICNVYHDEDDKSEIHIETISQLNKSKNLLSVKPFPNKTNQEELRGEIIIEKLEETKKTKTEESGKENETKNEEYSNYKVVGLRKTADKRSYQYFIRHKTTKEGNWISQTELLRKGSLALAISLIKYYESKLIFNSELPEIQ